VVTTLAFPDPEANLSAVFEAAHTMKKRIAFCTGGIAALCSVPAHAVPVDCWWGDPRDTDNRMLPRDCDVSRRVSNGQRFLDVYIKDINKRFSLRLTYENEKDNYGDAVFYYKGKKTNGHWQFDKDNDITIGVNGYKTHFAFSATQLMARDQGNGAMPASRERETLQDTPFRF